MWQDTLDFDEEDPGELGAARSPWHEGKVRPGAAGRITSAGWRGQQREAAEGPSGWCGGVGFVPPNAGARGDQRPGPSGMRRQRGVGSASCAVCSGCGKSGAESAVGKHGVESDASFEDGELADSETEVEWWERGKGRWDVNPVPKSLQVEKSGRGKDRAGVEARSVQEWPPLLSLGEESSCSMVSVALEAREDSVRLVKGVHVQDTGVITETGAVKEAGTDAEQGKGSRDGPSDKKRDMVDRINDMLRKRKVTVRHVQVLLGHLNFACRVVRAGRTFCRRLALALSGQALPHHHVPLQVGVREDLRMWVKFLESFNGIPLRVWRDCDWDVRLFSSAAGSSGFGLYWDGCWCAEQWPSEWKNGGRSIAFLELFPLVVAVCLWGAELRHSRAIFHVDNLAVVQIVNRQTSQEARVLQLMRVLVLQCLRNDIYFRARSLETEPSEPQAAGIPDRSVRTRYGLRRSPLPSVKLQDFVA
ncbi:hypothetical protein NDU88_001717 [Pleurodeles waltl]|uniref:Uncharacterized protein n=1 Tax=Pleurodeles waltl TaxID=8319 RepID=A0AAV7Q3X8_PLEWA|nr:hypothetical protein NDU88_001717 [Pleurodeles waltl]